MYGPFARRRDRRARCAVLAAQLEELTVEYQMFAREQRRSAEIARAHAALVASATQRPARVSPARRSGGSSSSGNRARTSSARARRAG